MQRRARSSASLPQEQALPGQPRWYRGEWLIWLGVFALIYGIALALTFPSLSYDWFGDDLLLVRPYTPAELISGLTGNYEPSGANIAGYRPLTRVFYHVSYLLSGGSFVGYHLLQIGFFAAHVTLIGVIGRRLGMTWVQVVLAAVIMASMKNMWWMTAWATDAIRPFMGIIGSLAILALLAYFRRPRPWLLAATVIGFTLAILTREEILHYAVIIPAVSAMYLLQRGELRSRRRTLIALTIVLFGIAGVFWLARRAFVPDAGTALQFSGWIFNLVITLFPRMPVGSVIASAVAIGVFWLAMLLILLRIPRDHQRLALFWLAGAVIACSSGMGSWRGNQLILPISFFALALGTIFGSYTMKSRGAARYTSWLVVPFLIGSMILHQTAQENLHPLSTDNLYWSSRFLWGQYKDAPMPPERVERLRERFAALGVTSLEEYEAAAPGWAAAALAANRRHPDDTGQPFAPEYGTYLHGW